MSDENKAAEIFVRTHLHEEERKEPTATTVDDVVVDSKLFWRLQGAESDAYDLHLMRVALAELGLTEQVKERMALIEKRWDEKTEVATLVPKTDDDIPF